MKSAMFAVLVILGAPVAAAAQTHVSLTAGVAEYDLSGVNKNPIYAVRVAGPVHPRLLVEGGLSYIATEQQFGDADLFLPEVQAQLQGTWGRFRPYFGLGGGLAIERPEADTGVEGDIDFSPSVALGVRVDLNPKVGVRIDGRLHGIQPQLRGMVSGLAAGLTIGL